MVNMSFIGQHIRTMDSKNRIALPAQYKNAIGDKFYIILGIDGHPEIRTVESFNELTSDLGKHSFYDISVRSLRRTIFGSSQEIELDSQGRFIIPKQFMEKGAFQKDILFIGGGDYIEMWDPVKYEEYEKQFDTDKIVSAAQAIANGGKQNE